MKQLEIIKSNLFWCREKENKLLSPFPLLSKYSESRLMISPVNVIISLMWSLFIVPFTTVD